MLCRFCNTPLEHVFIDLINAPASNSFLNAGQLNEPEMYYPLKVYLCHQCFLVQIDEYKKSETIFDNTYVYFSSYSTSWVRHAKEYTDKMIDRFGYHGQSQIIEIASNDGYLLQFFTQKGIPVLGIEPTSNTAEVAIGKGIPTITDFFGVTLAQKLKEESGIQADLLLGNNVLAHVPDIVDFVKAMKIILAPNGVITMEFPHLMQLVDQCQFDTIYHEHFSYLSLLATKSIFEAQGLTVFDVEEIPTHGGSLRLYAKHFENTTILVSHRVKHLLDLELNKGMKELNYYSNFQQKALQVKTDFIEFLLSTYKSGKKIIAYGAAAKGNTLLNYCGIKNDWIDYVVDANPHKQNKYLPGSHIPVLSEEHIRRTQPDYVIILPWNLKPEITKHLSYISDWGGRFVVPIPKLAIF